MISPKLIGARRQMKGIEIETAMLIRLRRILRYRGAAHYGAGGEVCGGGDLSLASGPLSGKNGDLSTINFGMLGQL
jgi:hypothetical protein